MTKGRHLRRINDFRGPVDSREGVVPAFDDAGESLGGDGDVVGEGGVAPELLAFCPEPVSGDEQLWAVVTEGTARPHGLGQPSHRFPFGFAFFDHVAQFFA